MGENLFDGQGALAGGGEVRPDLSHRRVIGEPLLAHQAGDHQGGDGLGGGKESGEGVRAKGAGFGAVGPAAHEVDDDLALHRQGEASAQLQALGKVAIKDLAHGGEAGRAETDDLGHRASSVMGVSAPRT